MAAAAASLACSASSCLLALLTAVLCRLLVLVAVVRTALNRHAMTTNKSDTSVEATPKTVLFLVVLFNMAVVLGVNSFYVWITLNVASQGALTVIEMFMAVFKLVWNDLAVPRLFAYIHAVHSLSREKSFFFRICIVLFNNIVAPGAATAAINTDCFYYALTNLSLHHMCLCAAGNQRVHCSQVVHCIHQLSTTVYLQLPVQRHLGD